MREESFVCTGHYNPWDGHELRLYQGVDADQPEWDSGCSVWMSFWYMGYVACDARCGQHPKFRDRICNAWKLLRGKPVYAEEFVFEPEEAQRLARCLLEMTRDK